MPTATARSSASGPERVWRTRPGAPGRGSDPSSGAGGRRAREATVAVGAQDLVDLGAVDRLALEEGLGHLVQRLDVPAEEELRPLVGLEEDAAHLAVDLHRGVLRVVDLLREVAAEEDLLLLLAERHGPELL